MKKCYYCNHYYRDYFCGYAASRCWIYGSLDMDQKERHPDVSAEDCNEYEEKEVQDK